MAAKGSLVWLCYMVLAAACVKLLWQWLLPARGEGRGQVGRSVKAQTLSKVLQDVSHFPLLTTSITYSDHSPIWKHMFFTLILWINLNPKYQLLKSAQHSSSSRTILIYTSCKSDTVTHLLIVPLKNPTNKLKLKYYHLMLLSKLLPIKIVSTYCAHIQNITKNAPKKWKLQDLIWQIIRHMRISAWRNFALKQTQLLAWMKLFILVTHVNSTYLTEYLDFFFFLKRQIIYY